MPACIFPCRRVWKRGHVHARIVTYERFVLALEFKLLLELSYCFVVVSHRRSPQYLSR